MLAWIFTNYCRDILNPPHPTQMTAQSLLSSFIADGDLVTDWLYLIEVLRYSEKLSCDENIDLLNVFLKIQLICCISGTLSWLTVVSEGRLLTWIKSFLYIFISIPVCILWTFLAIPYWIVGQFETGEDTSEAVNDRIKDHVILPLWKNARNQKASYSSGALLLLGILFEDIPQLILTFFIEDLLEDLGDDKIKEGIFSYKALFSFLFAVFDIGHKVAQAWDLRSDVLNSFYKVKTSIRAHQRSITSLTVVGTDGILSSSWWDDNVKLWDARLLAKRRVQNFVCAAGVNDVVASGVSKVIAACRDKKLRCFDLQSKRIVGEPLVLDFIPEVICLSPTSPNSFFTSRSCDCQQCHENNQLPCDKCNIRRRSFNCEETVMYNRPASSLTFLDKIHFVSTCRGTTDVNIWNVNETEPIGVIEIEKPGSLRVPVVDMASRLFLIGDGSVIKLYEYEFGAWDCNRIFKGHDSDVLCLEKVNDSLFISTSDDCTAKLWNLTNESCLFTFLGHTDVSVHSALFLKERSSVATGDADGHLKIWSIKKFLNEDEEEEVPFVNNVPKDVHNMDHVRHCWQYSRSTRNSPCFRMRRISAS